MTNTHLRVWLVDDDASIRWVLERALKNAGMAPRLFEAAETALASLGSEVPDVLMTDIRMSGKSGLELLRNVHERHPELPVIVMTAHSDLGSAVSAYESGAFEYLTWTRRLTWCAARRRWPTSRPKSWPTRRRWRKSWARRPRCSRCFAPSAGCRVPA
jgi:DNA-binding NtrC family response regulator